MIHREADGPRGGIFVDRNCLKYQGGSPEFDF